MYLNGGTHMISQKIKGKLSSGSQIRKMFEEGNRLKALYGADNVFDFSLGNPDLEPPKEVKEALLSVLTEENQNLVHGYMNNAGYEDVRQSIAEHLNQNYGTAFSMRNILMTVGAAGGDLIQSQDLHKKAPLPIRRFPAQTSF